MTKQFDGSSGDEDWCDHWKQCVWFVPGQGIPIYKDQEVHLCAVHDETRISYNINTHSRIDAMMYNFEGGDFQLELSPERIAIYGDGEWRSFMSTVIRNTVSSICFFPHHYHTHTHTHKSMC